VLLHTVPPHVPPQALAAPPGRPHVIAQVCPKR